jgi:agmatine deiminase
MGWTERIQDAFPWAVDIARALEGTTPIIFVADTSENPAVFKKYLAEQQLDTTAYSFVAVPLRQAIALRDIGPVYLVNGLGEKKVVDFRWTFQDWLEKFLVEKGRTPEQAKTSASWFEKNQKTDSLLAVMDGLEVIASALNLDGGALEVNSKGSILLNEYWMLKYNPDFTKEGIEAELTRTLGVENFIWVGKGLVEDTFSEIVIPGFIAMGTDGHTDEYIRFANANTILLAWVAEEEKDTHPVHAENYRRLYETYQILQNARDQDGKPFNIVKVPLPDMQYRPVTVVEGWVEGDSILGIEFFAKGQAVQLGDTLQYLAASSYLNFLITNDRVLLPTYLKAGGSTKKEAQVTAIFTKLFPGKTLVWIDAMAYNWKGGGIHCFTKQIPKVPKNPGLARGR